MKIDNTDFNQGWAKTKTEAQFVAEFIHMDHVFPEAADKTQKLKDAYRMLTGYKESPVIPAHNPAPAQESGKTPVIPAITIKAVEKPNEENKAG